jgi:hypothetical protein
MFIKSGITGAPHLTTAVEESAPVFRELSPSSASHYRHETFQTDTEHNSKPREHSKVRSSSAFSAERHFLILLLTLIFCSS